MPDNSVDSIVTDPPYELGFIGKSWDATGIAFNVQVWQEALRVLKPGGHLIAFSGSRTYHRMAVAIEDAGFEIRDQIMWVYGSGFPKSHNISKGIDKAAGVEREVVGISNTAVGVFAHSGSGVPQDIEKYANSRNITAPATAAAKQWQGWGTALKPAHEPMVLARKPLIGTVANNVLTYGTGGLNIDGSRVGTTVETWPASRSYAPGQLQPGGKGETQATGDVPAGRFPANFIHDGSNEVVALFPNSKGNGATGGGEGGIWTTGNKQQVSPGFTDSGSAARFFYCAKASKRDRNEGLDGFEEKTTLIYSEKAQGPLPQQTPSVPSPRANHHPTVKPTSLMQYLVRLVTPPNGIVLDPFMGSGSTGKACAYENFDFIGIDQSAEYVEIARARIFFAIATNDEKLPL